MTDAGTFLRAFDIERPEPGADILDLLEADGHDRNGFCEKCWEDAGKDPSAYLALLDERDVEAAQ